MSDAACSSVRAVYRLLIACFILACISHSHAQTQAQTQTQSQSSVRAVFHGFSVDMSRLNVQQQAFITPVLSAQFELILRSDLPPLMVAFMKNIPVVVEPGLPVSATAALFSTAHSSGRGVVKTSLVPMPSDKPVLLHEMLHAYDWNYWRFGKSEIQSAYAQAMNKNLYPQWSDSQWLLDAREFFAVSATVYLVGRIKQAPFDCSALSALQPEYVKFLAGLLGHHAQCDSVTSPSGVQR